MLGEFLQRWTAHSWYCMSSPIHHRIPPSNSQCNFNFKSFLLCAKTTRGSPSSFSSSYILSLWRDPRLLRVHTHTNNSAELHFSSANYPLQNIFVELPSTVRRIRFSTNHISAEMHIHAVNTVHSFKRWFWLRSSCIICKFDGNCKSTQYQQVPMAERWMRNHDQAYFFLTSTGIIHGSMCVCLLNATHITTNDEITCKLHDIFYSIVFWIWEWAPIIFYANSEHMVFNRRSRSNVRQLISNWKLTQHALAKTKAQSWIRWIVDFVFIG